MPSPVRAGVTALMVGRFFRWQHWRAVFGYREAVRQDGDDERICTITGVMVLFASLAESLDILCEIDRRFENIRNNHAVRLATWKRMRNDGAHPADRIFREPGRPGQNNAVMPNGAIYVFVFDRDAGTLQTGEAPLNVSDEIDTGRQIGREVADLAGFNWDDLH